MILEFSDGGSAMARAAAAIILGLHIAAGIAGVSYGMVALFVSKGSRLHRRAGHGFLLAMLVMAGIGGAVSPFLPIANWGNVVAGVFTCYLVLTSWMTVRFPAGGGSRFAMGALIVALAITAGDALLGLRAAASPAIAPDGTPVPAYFIFAAAGALAALGDLRLIMRGSITGPARINRHLWRMCLALFIACASFFLGQPQVFPPPLRGSPVLLLPEVAVLGAMLYWLAIVPLWGGARRRSSRGEPSTAAAASADGAASAALISGTAPSSAAQR
jgi:uncharacterized membrane protein